MTAPLQQDARLALLEAELLYLCADVGGDVLARAIGIVETLHAGTLSTDEVALAAHAIVVPFGGPSLVVDAAG